MFIIINKNPLENELFFIKEYTFTNWLNTKISNKNMTCWLVYLN